MKILMLLETDFPPDTRVENEISALTDSGHKITVACYSTNKPVRIPSHLPYEIHKTYIPSLIHKSSVGALKTGIYFNFWKKHLNKLFKESKFDAIHVHDLPLAKVGYEFGRKYKIPFILDLHENWPALLEMSTHTKTFLGRKLSSYKQWTRYEKWAVSVADKVIVVVDESKKRLVDLGADPEKIHIVSNTINPEHFNFPAQERDPDFTTLVYGGGVTFHRGLQTVIEALDSIKKEIPNIRVWIVGSGGYLENLKNLAKELGVEESVHFYGWKPLSELLKLVSQADIALIPHIKSAHTDSTIPHKLFQYMYAGIPVLTSDCDPLQRIVDETQTGISFTNLNARSLAENLIKLQKDESFRLQMPASGKKWVTEKYNWSRDAEILTNIYNKDLSLI